MEEMRKRKTANRDRDGTTPEPESHHEQHEEEESKPTVTPQSPTEENIFDDISQLSDYSQYSDEDSDQNHTVNRDSDGTTPEPESHHEQHQEEESKPTVTPQSPTEENIADEDDDMSPPYFEQCSEEDRDIQLAIIASLENPIDDDKVIASSLKRKKIDPLSFTCEICVEPKSYLDFFHIIGCTHTYCSDCIINYVASKLQESIPQIRCPVSGCGGLLEPEHCRTILPPELFDSWGKSFCEAVIPGSEKLYCPYTDCSALLIDDDHDQEGGGVRSQVECPNCSRLFCADCKVSWHWNMECADFQKMDEDEKEEAGIRFKQLAEKKRWIRCPHCRFYVEKTLGCNSVRCRCGQIFCYGCGQHTCKCSGVKPLLNFI